MDDIKPIPISLDELLNRGVMIGAYRADKASFNLPGIGPQRLTLPMPDHGADEDSEGTMRFTVKATKVIKYFGSKPSDYNAKGSVISSAIKESDSTMRKHYTLLVSMGVLEKMPTGDGYGRGLKFDEALEIVDVL